MVRYPRRPTARRIAAASSWNPTPASYRRLGMGVAVVGGIVRPPPPRHSESPRSTPPPLCETMGELISGNYKGEINDQEWVPKTCHAVPMSPFAWTRNTKCQATITMMGDGHVRNLFTATINGLRGVRAFAEAHEDREAKSRGIAESYFWRLHKDGTASDRYAVHVDTYARNADIFEDCPCDEVEKCLRIAFVWAPKFEDQLRQLHVLTNEKSDVVIVSPGNAAEPIDALPYIWTAAFDDLLREYENLQLGVVQYPFGMQPEGRAAALAHWTTNNTAHAGRMSFLNQKEMKHVPTNSKNMTKYACGLGKVNVENDNIIAIKPCTDLTDAAHVRALITVHLDALG
ncbi:hypothetical protein ACHAXA_011381 [Cyclostephanos tholiformis]|uniref:Uncharacterized protein n=1 Tax=Cyclostephanos tholiformis TaxID=382380 RepID=A0ABD3R1Y2_9STRA